MDYEKAYKEALERARKSHDKANGFIKKEWIETILPELKESEDEKIREMLISIYKKADMSGEIFGEGITYKQVIAWLEKQDPKKFEEKLEKAYKFADEVQYRKGYEDAKCEIEKQGKQKSIDNVEPKFKVGDWIINEDGEIAHINDIKQDSYGIERCYIEFINGIKTDPMLCFVDENFHLWTIQDAKDGDVLACEPGERTLECLFIFKLIADREVHEYCSYRTIDKHFSLKDSFLGYVDNVYHPATKEQRDILFSKMKEAGYEWDFDKKELRKIDDYCKENCKGFQETCKCYADGKCKAKREVEQKPADETPYSETLDKAIDLYYYTYGNGNDGFDNLSLDKFRDIVHTFIEDYGQKSTEWSEDVYNAALQALQWEEQQLKPNLVDIDKACEWINDQAFCGMIEYPADELIEEFKKAMKGE